MSPDLQTDLYDPDSVENDLRHSAKGEELKPKPKEM